MRILILITALTIFFGCTKYDLDVQSKSESEVVDKFFNTLNTSNSLVNLLIQDLKERNSKKSFIYEFANSNGFPVWDKAEIYAINSSSHIVYVPLTQIDKRQTTAIIRAHITNNITISSFNVNDYKRYQFSDNDEQESANHLASLFMHFDFKLFSTDKFIIKDSRLFHGQRKFGESLVKFQPEEIKTPNRLSDCIYFSYQISWLEADPENCNCQDPTECDWATGCTYCSNSFNTTLSYNVGCTTGGGSSDAQWDPYPPPGGGGGTVIGPIQPMGWVPFPNDPAYDDFVNNTLNSSQRTYWNTPGNSGFVTPLVQKLIDANFSYESKIVVQQWVNFLIGNNITLTEYYNYFMSDPQGSDGFYDEFYWDDPNLTFQQSPLPSLAAFTSAFPKTVDPVTGKISEMSSPDVFQLVGGSPLIQHNAGNPYYQNACSLRGSRALNYCGRPIDNNATSTIIGDDGKKYILTAKAFNKYMNKKFPAPSFRLTASEINGDPQKIVDFLRGKTGIYSMITKGGSFSGHVDLILSGQCLSGSATGTIANVDFIEIWILN